MKTITHEMIYLIAVCTVMILFVLTLLNKWGISEYYDLHKRKWMPKRCAFCLAFWGSLILTLIFQPSLTGAIIVPIFVSVLVNCMYHD